MKTTPDSGGVTGAIADIESRRLTTEDDAGTALACSAALHRLRELLDHETVALRLRGPASTHLANIQVVSAEIGRVRRLGAATSRAPHCRTIGRAAGR